MRKIKVLHIAQSTGGVQRHVIDLVSNIDKNKFEVIGICPPVDLIKGVSFDKDSFLEAFRKIGVKVYLIKMHREIKPISDLLAFLKIYNFIKKEKFDIVHTHSSKAGFLGRIAARLAGVPVVIHTPNSFAFDRPNRMLMQKMFYVLLEKFAGFFCDKVIAVCDGEKRLAIRVGVLPAKKIEVINNAIDLSLYDTKFDIYKKREELGVKEKDKIAVSVGRMAAQKAPLDFIEASRRVKEIFPCAVFLFLGDGPLLEESKGVVEKRGLSDFVKIMGWRNDTKEIVAASDIFVLSSLWEGLPYSLLDAMALGKPIVTTDTLGSAELVLNNYNGFVVPKGRPDLLAEAILKLFRLSDFKLLEFGRHSREILEKKPQLKEAVERTEKLYENALG